MTAFRQIQCHGNRTQYNFHKKTKAIENQKKCGIYSTTVYCVSTASPVFLIQGLNGGLFSGTQLIPV